MRIKDVLINAQCVNKTWHGVVQNSLALQRALFFEPIANASGEADVAPHFFSGHGTAGFIVNPFRQSISLSGLNNDFVRTLRTGDAVLPGFDNPDASWRRMFITQPPTSVRGKARNELRAVRLGRKRGADKAAQRWILFGLEQGGDWRRVHYAHEV